MHSKDEMREWHLSYEDMYVNYAYRCSFFMKLGHFKSFDRLERVYNLVRVPEHLSSKFQAG